MEQERPSEGSQEAQQGQTSNHHEHASQTSSIDKPGWRAKLQSKLAEYGRVLRITKKPSKEEYKIIVKVSGLGIIAIGLLGFLIHIVREVLFK